MPFMSPLDCFNTVNKCLGWGDPGNSEEGARSLWIIGIEEATAWASEEEVANCIGDYKCDFLPVTKADKKSWVTGGSKIRYYTSLIAVELSKMASEGEELDYEKEILWEEGSGICQANLFPLGKPSLVASHDKDELRRFWGISSSSEYYDKVKSERLPHFKSLHHRYNPLATICFGKSNWEMYENIFGLKNGCFLGPRKDNILVFERQRFILTGFLDNRQMSREKTKDIARQLKTWNVTLP